MEIDTTKTENSIKTVKQTKNKMSLYFIAFSSYSRLEFKKTLNTKIIG